MSDPTPSSRLLGGSVEDIPPPAASADNAAGPLYSEESKTGVSHNSQAYALQVEVAAVGKQSNHAPFCKLTWSSLFTS